jgi:hypothetical protein
MRLCKNNGDSDYTCIEFLLHQSSCGVQQRCSSGAHLLAADSKTSATNLFCTSSIRPSWGACLVETLRLAETVVLLLVPRVPLLSGLEEDAELSLSRALEPAEVEGFFRLLPPGRRAEDMMLLIQGVTAS